MRHPIVRQLRPVTLIATGLAAFALLAAIAWNPAPAAKMQPRYSPTEQAYIAEMTRILDVDRVDPAGSLAGGRNACYLIGEFGLDPVTLDGWDEHWHQPWERQWLEAAVAHLCPAG